MAAPAWYAQGYAVWSGAGLAAAGGWVFWRGARAWPGAFWRRCRGVAYVPGELAGAHLTIVAGLAVLIAGGSLVAVEWGLRGFQSYGPPVLAGQLELQVTPERISAAWTDPFGRWTQSWSPPCPRLALEGEFVEWSRVAHTLGFRDRQRVAAGRLSCLPDATPGGGERGARFRPPDPTWEALERWERWVRVVRTERRESPALRAKSGTWKLYVLPGGYVFSE